MSQPPNKPPSSQKASLSTEQQAKSSSKDWMALQWKPLGHIRDTFALQLEQDATWDRYRP